MEVERNGRPRVVVTGLGAITPLGNNVDEFWNGLTSGRSGIRKITQFDPKCIGVKVAGEIDFSPAGQIDPKEARRMSRDSQFAVVATREAMKDAGLTGDYLATKADDVGVVLGTTLGGYEIGINHITRFPDVRMNPFALLNSLPNLSGYYVSKEVHGEGPSLTISTACASGTQSISEGANLIFNNQAEIVFAGGVEGLVQECLLAGLEAMGVMALGYEDNPTEACRPFDLNRKGLVFSEGVAIVVLESLANAQARGAHIYAEVLGSGMTTDITSAAIPDATAKPARLAMVRALKNAQVSLDKVGYINPHGPGTKGDAVETLAIKQVFGERAYQIPISSTKSMLGHCMGAAGAAESIATIKAIETGVIHPTINYVTPDPECDLDYVPNVAREAKIEVALCNNFGLGGQNATVVFGKI